MIAKILRISRNTLTNYRKQGPVTRQQKSHLFNRIDKVLESQANTPVGLQFSDYFDRLREFRDTQRESILCDWFEPGTLPPPQPGMIASNFPHSHCLASDMGWLNRKQSDFETEFDARRYVGDTLLGAHVPNRFLDIWVIQEYTEDNRIYLLRSMDSMILAAAIQDAENLLDTERVSVCLYDLIDRLASGEGMPSLRKWSIQQLWQGSESKISRIDLIHQFAELTGYDQDTVESKIKAWQKGRHIQREHVVALVAIVGFHQAIPFLVVAFIRSMNLINIKPESRYWGGYDWRSFIEYWRPLISVATREMPGLEVPRRGYSFQIQAQGSTTDTANADIRGLTACSQVPLKQGPS